MRTFADQFAPLLDNTEYPTRWPDYIGQEPAKLTLQVAAKSAKIRKVPLPHILISHPSPGIGKTALALLVGREVGKKNIRAVSGVLGPNGARLLFAEMKDGDVLFYEEIHQIMNGRKKDQSDWMLTYLQDGVLLGPMGPETVPKVTIIGATTDPGRLPEPVVERFLQPPMQDYTDDEAIKITLLTSKRVLAGQPKLGKVEAGKIAAAATNNPRRIKKLLEVLRDMTITGQIPLKGTRYDVDALLVGQGITPDGLDRTAQKYLQTLAMEFAGQAGATAIEDRLQQAGGLATVERVLMDKGYLVKTRGGRVLTSQGIGRVRELVS